MGWNDHIDDANMVRVCFVCGKKKPSGEFQDETKPHVYSTVCDECSSKKVAK